MAMRGEDSRNLFYVIHVVTRHMYGKISDCNPAALGMNAETFPLVSCERFQELQICVTEQSEQCK
jgi:hypothetical protein